MQRILTIDEQTNENTSDVGDKVNKDIINIKKSNAVQ
jgi:hypothetical protein